MGILGSAFGRGLAGAASAGADMANKYLDEQLMQQRAEAMATLQRKTAGLIRADDDAFRNDPVKIARDRGNKVADIEAEGGARNATALAGAKAMATDTELRQAKIDAENAFVTGTSQAKSDAEAQGYERMTPLMARRAAATADADARTRAKYREQPPGVQKKIEEIEGVLGRKMTEEEKMKTLGLITGGRDPELDTETVTEEKMNPDGTVVKTQRKQVRRPGEKGPAQSDDPIKAAMDAARKGKAEPGKPPKAGEKPAAEPAKPEWQPDPNSPVAKQRTLMEQARAKQTAERAGQEQQSAQARQAATQEAERIMATGDKRALYQFQSSDQFKALDFSTKAKIAQIINGQ